MDDIVEQSNNTLRRLEQDDPKLKSLYIVNPDHPVLRGNQSPRQYFWLHDGADLSRLGNAIANNTQLQEIIFHESTRWGDRFGAPLLEGLQRNADIKKLSLYGGIEIGILNQYVANNSSLVHICIHGRDLRGGVVGTLAPVMKRCPNLNIVSLLSCKLDDESIKDTLGIKGLRLRQLHLCNLSARDNSIGIEGAKAIGSLVKDVSCSLTDLRLRKIGFDNESIQIVVNSLMGNTKLKQLSLYGNKIEMSGCDSIIKLLQTPTCNITSLDLGDCGIKNQLVTKVVSSLRSNTKLECFGLPNSYNSIGRSGCESIATLLQDHNSSINKIELSGCKIDDECATILAQSLIGNNKLKCLDLARNPGITESGWNAFSTILLNSSNTTLSSLGGRFVRNVPANLSFMLKLNLAVDMEPLFELDLGDDERKPKALPSVIDWFDRLRREYNQMRKLRIGSMQDNSLQSSNLHVLCL